MPASKLCLGLLHGLAADGLSGLPRASGSQSWLSFDSEDFTHFYSFVKKGPSKCFMKPTLENINGSNFAFEKAEVNVYLGKRHGMLKLGLHMSVCLSMNFYPKVLFPYIFIQDSTVSGLVFKSLIHFKLTFVRSRFILLLIVT